MTFFYWLMALVMLATLMPSALYMGIYVFTGADEALQRTLAGFNVMLWGHVLVAVWSLFH